MSLSKKSSKVKNSKKPISKKNMVSENVASNDLSRETIVNKEMIEENKSSNQTSEDVGKVPPVGSAEYGRLVREKYSNPVNEVKILSDDLYDRVCRRDRIIESITELKNEKDVIEQTIMELMKENDMAFVKNRKITWKKISRTSFDSKLLKEEEPEIYNKYSKVTSSRVFKIR